MKLFILFFLSTMVFSVSAMANVTTGIPNQIAQLRYLQCQSTGCTASDSVCDKAFSIRLISPNEIEVPTVTDIPFAAASISYTFLNNTAQPPQPVFSKYGEPMTVAFSSDFTEMVLKDYAFDYTSDLIADLKTSDFQTWTGTIADPWRSTLVAGVFSRTYLEEAPLQVTCNAASSDVYPTPTKSASYYNNLILSCTGSSGPAPQWFDLDNVDMTTKPNFFAGTANNFAGLEGKIDEPSGYVHLNSVSTIDEDLCLGTGFQKCPPPNNAGWDFFFQKDKFLNLKEGDSLQVLLSGGAAFLNRVPTAGDLAGLKGLACTAHFLR